MISQVIVNILASASGYALVAIGFSAVYGTGKFFHLAHGFIFSLGAYLFLAFSPLLPNWALLPAAILGSLLMAFFMDTLVYRLLRLRRSGSAALLLASLGILTIGQNALSIFFGDGMKRLPGTVDLHTLSIFGVTLARSQAYLILAGLATSIVAYALMRFSLLGRLYRAISNDPELAKCFGINVDRFFLLVLAGASSLACIAGVLEAMDTGLVPTMGFRALLMAIVAAIVGGIGTPLGAINGALIVSTTQNLAIIFLPSEWQDVAAYVLLIIFLARRPAQLSR